eukprot:1735723-Pleurochrysis_carterae.AAC.1
MARPDRGGTFGGNAECHSCFQQGPAAVSGDHLALERAWPFFAGTQVAVLLEDTKCCTLTNCGYSST